MQHKYQDYIATENYNNKLIDLHNNCIAYAFYKGVQFWRNRNSSNIYYRINKYGKKQKLESEDELYGLLNLKVRVYNDKNNILLFDNSLIIIKSFLTVVETEIFYPHSNQEWCLIDNCWYKNTFKSTKYLKKSIPPIIPTTYTPFMYYPPTQQFLPPTPTQSIQNDFETYPYVTNEDINESILINFLRHMFYGSNKDYNFNWIINWINTCLVKHSNSGAILILIGDKKTTDIFIHKIIKPIFIENDSFICKINNDTVNKKQKVPLSNKLIYHIDNIEEKNKQIKYLQDIVLQLLNNCRLSEPDLNNFSKSEIIITSEKNNPYFFLEDCYSLCSVLKVSKIKNILKKMDIDLISLYENIQNDLHRFSDYLIQTESNMIYNSVIENEEKKLLPKIKNGIFLTRNLDTKINSFVKAIKYKTLSYFDNIKADKELYEELKHNFEKGMIAQPLLGKYFDMTNDYAIFADENDYFLQILKAKSGMFNVALGDDSKYKNKKRYIIS